MGHCTCFALDARMERSCVVEICPQGTCCMVRSLLPRAHDGNIRDTLYFPILET